MPGVPNRRRRRTTTMTEAEFQTYTNAMYSKGYRFALLHRDRKDYMKIMTRDNSVVEMLEKDMDSPEWQKTLRTKFPTEE